MKRKDMELYLINKISREMSNTNNAIKQQTESNEKIEKAKLDVKDRVDISLKEYNELKLENKTLKEELNNYKNILNKFPEPALEVIVNNEIDDVAIIQNPLDLNYYIKMLIKKRW